MTPTLRHHLLILAAVTATEGIALAALFTYAARRIDLHAGAIEKECPTP